MLTPWPAAGPALAFLQLVLGSSNAALTRGLLLGRRKFPVVGGGGGVWSFIHIADAAEATVAAVECGSRGVYNVLDDDSAPVAEWLSALAQALGAKNGCACLG